MVDWVRRLWSRWEGNERDRRLRSLARRSGDPFRVSPYYEIAETHTEELWRTVAWPWIDGLDHRCVMDLAAGHGRHSAKLEQTAGSLVIVDINEECLRACRERFGSSPRFRYVKTDGYSLDGVEDASVTLVFSFDAMVHFDPEVVRSYLPEIRRVLVPGGHGFCHHSNYSEDPGGDFHAAPHWRSHMSVELFRSMCEHAELDVLRSEPIDWGGADDVVPALDALTLFRRP